MGRVITTKTSGSTMLEPLTAVVIISLTLTLAGISFSSMMRNHTLAIDQQIEESIEELKGQEKASAVLKNRSIAFDLFDIDLSYSGYKSTLGVKQQTFIARDKEGHELLTKHFLVAHE